MKDEISGTSGFPFRAPRRTARRVPRRSSPSRTRNRYISNGRTADERRSQAEFPRDFPFPPAHIHSAPVQLVPALTQPVSARVQPVLARAQPVSARVQPISARVQLVSAGAQLISTRIQHLPARFQVVLAGVRARNVLKIYFRNRDQWSISASYHRWGRFGVWWTPSYTVLSAPGSRQLSIGTTPSPQTPPFPQVSR